MARGKKVVLGFKKGGKINNFRKHMPKNAFKDRKAGRRK